MLFIFGQSLSRGSWGIVFGSIHFKTEPDQIGDYQWGYSADINENDQWIADTIKSVQAFGIKLAPEEARNIALQNIGNVIKVFDKRICVTSACAGAAMYRRSVFDEIGYFDEEHFCYLEDVDLGYRARLYGYINVMEPKAIAYHVGSGSSGSRHNSFKVELTAANNLYLIYKNMPAWQVVINLPLVIIGILIKHVFYMKKGLGKAHIRGLCKGFSKIHDNPGKKVVFKGRRLANSFMMQLELWANLFVILGHLGRF